MAYNYSDDPEELFRADVLFRTREDVKKERDMFFDDLEQLKQMMNPDFEDEAIDENRKTEHLEAISVDVEQAAGKIQAVWGFSVDQLETMTTGQLLGKAAVTKFLSKTRTLCGSNKDEFAAKVKPYIDSTYTEVEGPSDAASHTMAVWPLIDHVRVYVKLIFSKEVLIWWICLASRMQRKAEPR